MSCASELREIRGSCTTGFPCPESQRDTADNISTTSYGRAVQGPDAAHWSGHTIQSCMDDAARIQELKEAGAGLEEVIDGAVAIMAR